MANYLDETGLSLLWEKIKALFKANDAMQYMGTYAGQGTSSASGVLNSAFSPDTNRPRNKGNLKGWTYKVTTEGYFGNVYVEVGDMIIINTDDTFPDTSRLPLASFDIIQTNIDGAVTGPASAVDGAFVQFDGTTGKKIKASSYTTLVSSLGGVSGAITLRGGLTTNGSVSLAMSGSQLQASIYGLQSFAYKSSLAFSELTSKPTTIAGYGITDAYTKTETDALLYDTTMPVVSALAMQGNRIADLEGWATHPSAKEMSARYLSVTEELDVYGTYLTTKDGVFNISNATRINGAVTLDSTLGVTGATTLSTLGVTGNTTVGGTLGVTGATSLGALSVGSDATFSGNVIISYTSGTRGLYFGVSGSNYAAVIYNGSELSIGYGMRSAGLNKPLILEGSNITLNSTASIAGNTTIGASGTASTLTVWGVTTLKTTLNANGNVIVGTAGTNANLTVNGNASITGTLGVTGATTLSSTLNVSGVTTLANKLVFSDTTTRANKGVYFRYNNADVEVLNAFTSGDINYVYLGSGTYTTHDTRIFGKSIQLRYYKEGATTSQVALTVSQDTGKVTIGASSASARVPFVVYGDSTLNGTLAVTGATTLGSTLDVTGATTLKSTLGVWGNTTIGRNASGQSANLQVYGNINASGYIEASEYVKGMKGVAAGGVSEVSQGSGGSGTTYDITDSWQTGNVYQVAYVPSDGGATQYTKLKFAAGTDKVTLTPSTSSGTRVLTIGLDMTKFTQYFTVGSQTVSLGDVWTADGFRENVVGISAISAAFINALN